MAAAYSESLSRSPIVAKRWTCVAVAALAMVATLPGRTHGLGLITEPLLAELRIGRVDYGIINLWATLLGALFCLPCGWLADRVGLRLSLSGVVVGLGAVVVVMSQLSPTGYPSSLFGFEFFLLVLLTRGFGQSALSVNSLALVGRAAQRNGGVAMAVYSALVTVGFMAAFGVAKIALEYWHASWRELWLGIGLFLLIAVAPLGFWAIAGKIEPIVTGSDERAFAGSTLGQALRTPAFWIFALATSLYGLIASGVSLFNESILQERGFDRSVFLNITVLAPLVGLAGNLLTGWLANRYGMGRLLALAMVVLSAALTMFPWVETEAQVYAYAVTLGFAGGMVTVIFFGVWVQRFGTLQLGRIQGAAQMLTVLASAVGPLLLALSKENSGSYLPLFRILAVVAAFLAALAWRVR